MMQDGLVICNRCGSDACYHQNLGADYSIYLCYGCGFTTNTLMHSESKFLEEQLEVLPKLYKDLIYIDSKGLNWMPSGTNNPEKGMVYADGNSAQDWKWIAVKTLPLEKEDTTSPPTYKMDTSTLKTFEEKDYMEALDYIGMFERENLL